MSGLENLSKHTIRKTTEVDGEVKYEHDLSYFEYCEELADLLYNKVACKRTSERIRWGSTNNLQGVHMPTVYCGNGVVVRYKVVD